MPRRSRASAPKTATSGPEASGTAKGGGAGNAARAQQLQGKAGATNLEKVQRAFGKHDISGISMVHSSAQADAFGAAAMAQGETVTFGSSPDLHTMAHELAHVVQQRAGVQLTGGVGSEGDQYERNADAVADLVVKGQSAESLLDQFTGGRALGKTASAGQGVQRKKKKTVSGNAMARLKHAKAGIEHSKEILSFGAGNQKEALEASNFNSYFRMAAMRDPECWYISPSVRRLASQHPDALTTAKAQLAKGGNCGEHAQVGFEYLRATATGETINRVDVEGLDHAFVMIGDAKTEDGASLVICDPWPTAPTACLWEDHFAHDADKAKLNVRRTAKADGTDIVSVIARGVQLTAKGHAWVNHAMSEEETAEQVKKGTEGDKPWIWQHANAAGRWSDYEYETAAPAVTTPTQDTTGPSTTGPSTTPPGGETSTSTTASGGVESSHSGQSDQFGRRSPTQPPSRR
jgi:hypothetical protein